MLAGLIVGVFMRWSVHCWREEGTSNWI